ncbi:MULTISPECIES: hypothetical protein [unclassified Streptomyces]|uniref:hypothetical protein n=1 Tax=unclassified Streptomyces TaxID=2593676 RepID=UPI002E806C52|nr:hypothetical protein [Streptomyces sp. NBC_00589]WTI37846.1 hypothetical protein OIC96_23970 [Streptomyces sp. NBC_00775]WUB28475.1 hypothetical protein OHA51_25765 [Streptomyces sp. NBC_00589]
MTPSLSTLRTAGLLLVLMTGAGPPAYAAARAPYAAPPAPSADASRAGSLPGEGRARPGRAEPTAPDTPDAVDEGDEGDAEATEAAPDPAVPDRSEASAAAEPSGDEVVPVQQNVIGPAPTPEPVLQILPLGSGLILIGLGLGLAFVALRVRRR